MSIYDRLIHLRQLLPGGRAPEQDERLLQLYWNRAQLKKELTKLQGERRKLLDQMRLLEGAAARAREEFAALEELLGQREAASHALVYFRLRALWRFCAEKLAGFAQQLLEQQSERERRRLLMDFDQATRRRLADFDRRIEDARSNAKAMAAQLERTQARLVSMRGFWNHFRRRRLVRQIEEERSRCEEFATQVTDLSDDRADAESVQPPPFAGVSIEGRRIVNTAVIAYAQHLTAALSKTGLAVLARESTTKRVFDAHYGEPEECAGLLAALSEAHAIVHDADDDLRGLKERTDALRAAAMYRSDADTVPLTNSIDVTVLVEDYWDVRRSLAL